MRYRQGWALFVGDGASPLRQDRLWGCSKLAVRGNAAVGLPNFVRLAFDIEEPRAARYPQAMRHLAKEVWSHPMNFDDALDACSAGSLYDSFFLMLAGHLCCSRQTVRLQALLNTSSCH